MRPLPTKPMLVASLEATLGSVIAKHERMRPSSSGAAEDEGAPKKPKLGKNP